VQGCLLILYLFSQNATAEEVEDFERIVSGEHSNAAIFARRQTALAAAQIPREVELIRPSPLSTSPTSPSQLAPLPAKRPKVVGRMESAASVIPAVETNASVSAAPPPRVASVPSISTFAPNIDVPRSSSGYVTSIPEATSNPSTRTFQPYTNGSALTASRPMARRTASHINTTSRRPQFTTGFEYVSRQHVRRGGLATATTPALDMSTPTASAPATDSGCQSSDDLTSSTHSSPDSQLCQTPETTFVHPVNIVDPTGKISRSCAADIQETVYGPYSVYGCSDMPIPV
jgi:hypothetical protein